MTAGVLLASSSAAGLSFFSSLGKRYCRCHSNGPIAKSNEVDR